MVHLGLMASILGHIGDGNFHESILYNSKDPRERAAVEKCINDMVDRALEMEGTGVMKSIKEALDPYWLMNPGKIMDMPKRIQGTAPAMLSFLLRFTDGLGDGTSSPW